MKRNLLLILSVLFFVSCSVKEDRIVCPCRLRLDLSPCKSITADVVTCAWDDSGQVRYFRDEVSVLDLKGYYEQDVKRGPVNISVYTAPDDNVEDGRMIMATYGQDFDAIYSYADNAACSGEIYIDTVRLYKQYATVHVKLERHEVKSYPYSFNVESDVAGLDLITLSPVRGEFHYDIVFDDTDLCSFNIPRHDKEAGGLSLNIVKAGEIMDSVSLSEIFIAMDYDWTADDLDDIYIRLDYTEAVVRVSIADWGEGIKRDIVI